MMEWKKHVNRFTQMASQGLLRSEKSDVLNNNLQELEKKLEDIKAVCQKTSSKLSECLLSSAGSEAEKRLRKLPLYLFAISTVEQSSKLNSMFHTLSKVMQMVGDGEDKLAHEWIQYEMDVESRVMQPLKAIGERDIPAIQRIRKQLSNYTLDMDSAKNRYQKQQTDAVLQELDEAKMKVEQTQDTFAADLFSFATREEEFCRLFLTLLEAQAEYHRRSLAIIDHLKPQCAKEIEHNANRPVFKASLQSHLEHADRDIAVVIEECVKVLNQHALAEEGLFRIAGGKSRVNRLKAAFDANMVENMDEYRNDVHCVADVLKQYLRTLPEPLMTYDLYGEWMSVSQISADRRVDAVKRILDKLPKANYDNLRYLVKFLARLASHSEVNKMSPSNLAIVVGPNLLWPREDRGSNFQVASVSVELLITNADLFFPGAIDSSGADSSSTESSPYSGRRPILNPHDGQRSVPAIPTVNSQPVITSAAVAPSTQPSSTLTTSTSSYGDLRNAALVFPSSEELDAVSIDLDSSPKATTRRRAPPPPPVASQPETFSAPSASQPPLSATPQTSASQPTATLGHRRIASANTPISISQTMPISIERPHVPPPAPPRPGLKTAVDAPSNGMYRKLDDPDVIISVATEQSNKKPGEGNVVRQTPSNGTEEKANKTAELRAQWFQNDASTVNQLDAENGIKPVMEPIKQRTTNQADGEAANSSVASDGKLDDVLADSTAVDTGRKASESVDPSGNAKPIPVARTRGPQVPPQPINVSSSTSSSGEQLVTSASTQPSNKTTTARESAELRSQSVKKPPPPIVPRPASRQVSVPITDPDANKVVDHHPVEEVEEEEDENTRL